jgi:GNAT superfamily N-acetyltransferase
MGCILAILFISGQSSCVDHPTVALRIDEADSSEQLITARSLLEEYWASLGFDRETFGFGEELDGLPGPYARPEGRLALAVLSDQVVGCIALPRLDNDSCEMKRLFVRQSARGKGIALALLTWLVAEARFAGIFQNARGHVAYNERRLASLQTVWIYAGRVLLTEANSGRHLSAAKVALSGRVKVSRR